MSRPDFLRSLLALLGIAKLRPEPEPVTIATEKIIEVEYSHAGKRIVERDPVMYIYVDGFDPNNAAHRELMERGIVSARQKFRGWKRDPRDGSGPRGIDPRWLR